VFSRNLTKKLAGKTVASVNLVNKKLKIAEGEFRKSLEGAMLTSVYRHGKELHFAFDNRNILALHLMLRGELNLFQEKNEKKFAIVELVFADGSGLAMTDYQGQANASVNPPQRDAVDALSKEAGYKFLKDKFVKSKAAVKNVLLDQHVIRGIGNAYADEILWRAGISPFSPANKIPDTYIKALGRSIKTVLQNAEKSILKNNPEIISGEVRDFLAIHNAKKTHSPTGGKIKIKKSGARKTYYTSEQKLFR
jgi:formamidopyrimidine-DNA glycosylase